MSVLLENVCFAYPDSPDVTVIDIKQWAVAKGESVFLHGPSGSGKSTLLNILSGLLLVNSGCVAISDQSLKQLSRSQRDKFRAEHIGYVFQQLNLIPYLDIIDNIRLASHFSGQSNRFSLFDTQDRLSRLNIDPELWSKPASALSIGQQQRVAIARALANQPELLIVDEPTSSLDQKNRDDFMALLMPLVEENRITLVFVSHDVELSGYFKRIDALTDMNNATGV